jgi:lipid-A-disaccharide synthase-like uncharacterized protein
MKNYISNIDKLIKDGKCDDIDNVIKEHLLKIQFYQHERLIHFLVTMLFALLFIITFLYSLSTSNMGTLILAFIIFLLLVPYIFHYYFLENSVQHMYDQHDELVKMKK